MGVCIGTCGKIDVAAQEIKPSDRLQIENNIKN